jgi:hypothetical protein
MGLLLGRRVVGEDAGTVPTLSDDEGIRRG